MSMNDIQPLINIFNDIIHSNQIEAEKINEAIDVLENLKGSIAADDDEAIDKVDEIQDFFQYILTAEETEAQIKEEIKDIIEELQKW